MENDSATDEVRQQNFQKGLEVPLVDELPMAVIDDCDSNHQQKRDISSFKEWAQRDTRRMELLTGLIFVATLGQAIFAGFQWNTAQALFVKDQRPYVMSVADDGFSRNGLLMMNFRNGNYGKSPAIEVGGAGKVFFGDDAMQQADRWVKNELPQVIVRRHRTILPPNTPASHAEARHTTVISDRAVSDEQFAALLQKSHSIVAVMRQAYRDTAGNDYWTDSCVSNLVVGPRLVRVVDCDSLNHVE